MYGQGPFGKALDIAAQITGGVCPTCTHETMFVSINPEIFRCISCGSDCKQHINGQIRYLPDISCFPEKDHDGKTTKVRS